MKACDPLAHRKSSTEHVTFIISSFLCDLHCIHAAEGCHFITSLPFLLLFVESELVIRIIIIYLQGNVNVSQAPLGGREINLVLFTYSLRIHQMASNSTIWSPCVRFKQQNWWWEQEQFRFFVCLRMWPVFYIDSKTGKETKAHLDFQCVEQTILNTAICERFCLLS